MSGTAIVVVLVLIGAQVIPRWWSHRVASVVDGSLTTGAFYGLFIGFVFTLVPLVLAALVIRYATRQGRSWKGWIGWFVLVLLTRRNAGIVVGRADRAGLRRPTTLRPSGSRPGRSDRRARRPSAARRSSLGDSPSSTTRSVTTAALGVRRPAASRTAMTHNAMS